MLHEWHVRLHVSISNLLRISEWLWNGPYRFGFRIFQEIGHGLTKLYGPIRLSDVIDDNAQVPQVERNVVDLASSEYNQFSTMVKEGAGDSGSEIPPNRFIIVENWFEELRQRVPVN